MFFFFEDKESNRVNWIEKVKQSALNNKITIIQGLRRIGKTLLVETVARDELFLGYEQRGIDTKDFGIDVKKIAGEYIKEFKETPTKQFLLLVDEFQEFEQWKEFFWTLHKLPNVKVLATGSISANLDLVRETEGGRFVYIYMKPLSLSEYQIIHQDNLIDKNKTEVFNQYATMGSYPEQEFSTNLFAYKKQITDNIIEKIRNSDLLKRVGIDSSHDVTKVLLWLIENLGSMSSVNNMANKLVMNQRTIDKIINYLKQTFVIYEINNSKLGAGKAATYNRKFYLTDHTFYLFTKQSQYKDLDEYQDKLFENIIINQVKAEYEPEEAELNYFKNKDFDIDLIIRRNDKLHNFEIKNSESIDGLSKTQKEFSKNNVLKVIYLGKTQMLKDIQYINFIDFFEQMDKWI